MYNFENIWLENCPSHFKPIVSRRFVDDTFLIFRSKDHVEKFRNYLNKQHKNIKFTSEIEENGSLSFLDININRENYKFVTSVYHKPIFSGVFTNFESFIPDMYKRELIETLLHNSFRLCSNYDNFHQEIETLKSILKRSSDPHNLVNHRIKTIERNLPFCKLKIIFRSKCRLFKDYFILKIHLIKIHSGIIYRYRCSNCNVTYYRKTFHHFYTRAAEHMEISNLTGKRLEKH